MISNLDVNTVYTIEVSANNSIGEGNVTKQIVKTEVRGAYDFINIIKKATHVQKVFNPST